MENRFIDRKTSRLYKSTGSGSFEMVMIFGDEISVDVTAAAVNHRLPAIFRGRTGFVREDHFGTEAPLEIYFIDVGQGDATFIVTPNRKTILIDGGLNHRALGFLIWKYRLDHPQNSVDVDLLILSHADGDHVKGLTPIIEHDQIHVRNIIHSGIATFSAGFDTRLGDLNPAKTILTTWHDQIDELDGFQLTTNFKKWRDAVKNEGTDYRGVDSETELDFLNTLFPDISVEFLGPRYDFDEQGFPWFGGTSHTINGHSVVMRLTHGGMHALFPGDLNIQGSKHLLDDPVLAGRMSSHILKCPHHGSHEFHLPFLNAVRPQVSVVSSGDAPDHGHPRAVFLGAMGRASRSLEPLLFSTEIAATFVDSGETLSVEDAGLTLDALDFSKSAANVTARRLFKQSLPGIVNVRTNGTDIFAARRVASGYWWEAYGPVGLEP